MIDSHINTACRNLAVLGTGSDVGKSVIVAGLCRLFRQMGIEVAPFKAQNMSNNSFVTLEGGEIGRAQVVQAHAAGVEPHVDMNPVLLKPSTDVLAQVIVHGRAVGNAEAAAYFADTSALFEKALESYARLSRRHQMIVLEGAGSCAEVNLRSRDFVNFRMAHAVDAPVVLVADIDRGGVFGQIVGTLECMPPEDRRRVRGVIINRFRGDASLFADGMSWLEQRTGLPMLGLVPFFRHIKIDSEDGMPLDVVIDPPEPPAAGRINIAVIRLPHISNFTDFDPLLRQRCVRMHYLARPRELSGYDLVLLPGSKNVRADLRWLEELGWRQVLDTYVAGGGRVGGVCGGYQMLGRTIADPRGVEAAPGESSGLGYLPLRTTLLAEKTLTRTSGVTHRWGTRVQGYEIHMGQTLCEGGELEPWMNVTRRNAQPTDGRDGVMSADGRIWGTYLHGLLDEPATLAAFLHELNPNLAEQVQDATEQARAFQERQYDLLAEHLKSHLEIDRLMAIMDHDNGPTKESKRECAERF